MFYATYTKGNLRNKYLVQMQVNVSLMDMLFNKIKTLNIKAVKKVDITIGMLSYIKNIVYGWKINEDNKK